MTVAETSLRGFQPAQLQYQLRLQQPRLPLSMLLSRPGFRTRIVPREDRTLPVVDTPTGSVPFGNFGAKVDSMSSRPKSLFRVTKVYMVAGRAVTTDLGVLPSLMQERSTVVCVEIIITSQLSMLILYSAAPTNGTGTGICYYRLAPGAVGNFIPSSAASRPSYYAAARRLSGAPVNPVSCDMAYRLSHVLQD
jgi:hypothetical protein